MCPSEEQVLTKVILVLSSHGNLALLPRRLWEDLSPGVAGEAGAEDGVSHGNGDVVVMQPAVDPAVRHDVGPARDGTTCRTTLFYYQEI